MFAPPLLLADESQCLVESSETRTGSASGEPSGLLKFPLQVAGRWLGRTSERCSVRPGQAASVREAPPSNGAANALIGLPRSAAAAPPQPRHSVSHRWNGDGGRRNTDTTKCAASRQLVHFCFFSSCGFQPALITKCCFWHTDPRWGLIRYHAATLGVFFLNCTRPDMARKIQSVTAFYKKRQSETFHAE